MPRLSNERGDSLSAHVSSCIPACLCLCLCHCDPAVRPHPGRLCRYSNPHIGWPWWVCSTIEVHLQLLSSSLKDGYSQALRALCCTSSGFAVTVDKLQRKYIYSVRWSPTLIPSAGLASWISGTPTTVRACFKSELVIPTYALKQVSRGTYLVNNHS